MTVDGRQVPAEADRARMRAERHAKLQHQLAAQGLDGLLLLGTSAVAYATGAERPGCDSGRAALLRPVAVVVAGRRAPAPVHALPRGRARPSCRPTTCTRAAVPDLDDGAERPGGRAARRCSPATPALGLRRGAPPPGPGARAASGWCRPPGCWARPSCARPPTSWPASAGPSTSTSRRCSTSSRCCAPASTQTDLTRPVPPPRRRAGRRAATASTRSGRSCRRSLADGPWTVHGDIAFPTAERARCRWRTATWSGSTPASTSAATPRTSAAPGSSATTPRPRARQQAQFERWRAVVDAVLALCKPGVSALELGRAAIAADRPGGSGDRRPGSSTSTWPTASAPTAPRCR